ncbi:MAG: hypothetical protein IT383_13625 [Deltaproteobacteria bacterium]|nr:hypothetical protein [Deltaproteobacteria bacterium]
MLTLAFFGAPLAFGQVYLGVDHTRVLLAALCSARGADGAVLVGALGGGGPLLEDPQGLVLTPLAWALTPLPVELAASVFSVLHLAIGAAAVVLLAATFGLRQRTACWAGIAWPLTGTCINVILHGAYVADVAGLPLAWAGARRALAGRADGAVLVAAGLATMGLAGGLQGVGLAVALVALEATGAALRERKRRRPRAASRFGGLALGLGAGALATGTVASLALGLSGAAARAHGVEDPYAWALAWPELAGVAWPNAVVARDSVGATLQSVVAGDALLQPPWNGTPYLGVPLVGAAVVGAAISRRRRSARLVALAATLCSLGAATPVLPTLLLLVPPMAMFRYPSKYFLLGSLALLMLGIGTLDLASRVRRVRRALLVVLVTLGALSATALVALLLQRDALSAAAARVATHAPVSWAPPLSTVVASAGATATVLAVLAALLLAARAPRWRRFLCGLVVIDLALAAQAALPTGAPMLAELTSSPAVRPAGGLPSDAVVCLGTQLGARRLDLPDRDLGVAGDVMVDLIDGKPGTGQCTGVAVPNTYLSSAQAETIALARHIDERIEAPGDGLQAARALGCTHLVTRAALDQHLGLVPIARVAGAPAVVPRWYALAEPVPPATVARAPLLHARSDDAVAALLRSRGADEVVRHLDGAGADVGRGGVPASLPTGEGARVRAAFSSSTRGSLMVEGAGAVVVLRRPWWPGFAAESETGRGLPVLRAAGALLAVVVDDEEVGHTITLRYRVVGAPLALLCGGLALLLFVALTARWLWAWRTGGWSSRHR